MLRKSVFHIITAILCAVVYTAMPAAAKDADVIFDGYVRGIHIYELRVSADKNAQYTFRKKDLRKNAWGVPVTTLTAATSKESGIMLEGALLPFPRLLPALSAVKWDALQTVAVEGSDNLYVRHRALEKTFAGRAVTAVYWAAKDATDPMDLVVGDGNQLLAAIDVNADAVMVRRGYEDFTTVGAWRDPSVSQPLYGYRVLDLQMMPTRAGPRLATRVYLPEGDIKGPFPTILVRNPYGISELIKRYEQYVVRGFAVVLQAPRGTAHWDPESKSEGDAQLMVQEPDDSADTLEWVVKQSWSNGSICMQGLSYHAYTQWTSVMARNPALKCIVPESSLGTAFGDQPYMGGTFITGTPFYIFWMYGKKLLPGRTWPDVLRYRPLIDMDVYATGESIPAWKTTVAHWRNDEYWQKSNWFAADYPRDVAAFQISGWFDDDFPGTRSTWAMMQKSGTRANRLIIGPWKHSYNHDRSLNGFGFGLDSLRNDIWLLKQKWYDHYLKGAANGVTDATVQYFELGSNTWRTASAWPPAEAQPQNWYFNSSGKAARLIDDGTLAPQEPVGKGASDEFVYDPANPPNNWFTFDLMSDYADVQSFPYDFRDIEGRGDVVTYTSAPLEKDLTIAGNIKLVLYASTTAKDTDWWAHISDVTPDNASNRLTLGVLRARFRELDDTDYQVFGANFTKDKLLSGNLKDIMRYEITLRAIANTFKKGHRIRIAVMNAQDNYSFPNSNTGGDESLVTTTVPATMQIHHDKAAASHVILPVMPDTKP